jgi:phosphomannomutase
MTTRPLASIFREYDIRGTYGETLSDADAHAIGRAIAARFAAQGGRRMAVGRDGRLSSPALEAALVEGLRDGGVDVVRVGIGPTPMLYYAEASAQDVQGGVQVTGSHNPADDNGFKIVFGGRALFGAEIRAIGVLARQMAAGAFESGDLLRGQCHEREVLVAYVERLLCGIDGRLGRHREKAAGLRIGWDAGNGAAGQALEILVQHLPGQHHMLFTKIDGHFPHHHPDPTVEANLADLRSLVVSRRLDFGVAFDGDGDRIVVLDGQGRTLLGDQLLAILAQDLLLDRPDALILADVKASQTVFDHIARLGGRTAMGAAGHSLIKSTMKQNGALLAGETSGHIFYADDFYGFDDALYAAVRLIAAVARSDQSVAQMRDALPVCLNTPELRFAVDPARKAAVVEEVAARLLAEGAMVDRTDGLRVMRAGGWWLLRASNTQDMLTARAESGTQGGLAQMLGEIDAQLAISGVARG